MDERLNRKTPLGYICYYARMYKIINTVNITCFNFVLVNMWIIYYIFKLKNNRIDKYISI